ncbi:MAG: hypothetical protein ACE5DL_01775 [Nitrosopumilaceae archaeon]
MAFSQSISHTLYVLPVFVIAAGLFIVIWAGIWIKQSKMTNRAQKYTILVFDVNDQQITLDGLRTNFKNNEVAWSFMKEYKTRFPFYNFALVSTGKNPIFTAPGIVIDGKLEFTGVPKIQDLLKTWFTIK